MSGHTSQIGTLKFIHIRCFDVDSAIANSTRYYRRITEGVAGTFPGRSLSHPTREEAVVYVAFLRARTARF